MQNNFTGSSQWEPSRNLHGLIHFQNLYVADREDSFWKTHELVMFLRYLLYGFFFRLSQVCF